MLPELDSTEPNTVGLGITSESTEWERSKIGGGSRSITGVGFPSAVEDLEAEGKSAGPRLPTLGLS